MKLKIEIDLDNDVCQVDGEVEVRRALNDLCDRVDFNLLRIHGPFDLHDRHGVWMGEARIVGPHDDNDE